VFSSIPAHTEIKVMPWEKLKQLKPESIFTGIHGYPPKVVREGYHRSKFKSKMKTYVKKL
jgi:hypothetical protein